MAKKRRKRLLYLIADYESTNGLTLQEYLVSAYEALPTVQERVFPLSDKEVRGSDFKSTASEFIIRYTVCAPGEKATTIPTETGDALVAELDTMEATVGYEFSDGDVILLISGNDIFMCASLLSDRTIQPYLRALFIKANLEERACSVRISKPGNFEKLRILHNEGVKSININATLGGVDFSELENATGSGLLKKIWRAFAAEDKTLAQAANYAEARFSISLNSGKVTGDRDPNWLLSEAEDTLNATENYQITTKKGNVIKGDEIVIAKFTSLEARLSDLKTA